MSDTLQRAIAAIKANDKETGRHLLSEVLKADPHNETAWLWMSAVADTDETRRTCLKRVLAINPNNEVAKRGLEALAQKLVVQPPQAEKQPGSPPPTTTDALQPIRQIEQEATKKCPYCAETIKAEAVVCRFCGRDLQVAQPIKHSPRTVQKVTQKKTTPHAAAWLVLGFLVLAFVCLVGPVNVLVGNSPAKQGIAHSTLTPSDVASPTTAKQYPTPTNTRVIPDTPAPSATPTHTPGIGEWVYQGRAAVAITEIDRRRQIGIWEADSGYEFLSIAVTCAHRGDNGTVHCNPFDFRVMDSQGVIYSHEWVAQLEPQLQAVDLAPAAKTSGWVTFQIPIGDSGRYVLWQPSLFDSDVYIQLK